MPYKIVGNKVVKKDTGKVVGKSKNPKKYMRTLQAVEHGFVPTGKKGMHKMPNGKMMANSAMKPRPILYKKK